MINVTDTWSPVGTVMVSSPPAAPDWPAALEPPDEAAGLAALVAGVDASPVDADPELLLHAVSVSTVTASSATGPNRTTLRLCIPISFDRGEQRPR